MAAISFGFDIAAYHLDEPNGPLSGEEVQVTNGIIAKDKDESALEEARVQPEDIK